MTFKSLGGRFDLFIFYGPTFDEVIQQYQEVVGRPKPMPLWAHGFFSKSYAYQDSAKALKAIKDYKEMLLPLQGLALPLDNQNEYFTPDPNVVVDIR